MPSATHPETQTASKLPDVFRAYDIRGCAKAQLTPELYLRLGRAFATRVQGGAVCVGHDTRASAVPLAQALMGGLTEGGVNVFDLGCVTTPLVYWAEHHLHCDAALMVTGSHTPPTFNGLKFSLGTRPFYGQDLQILKQEIERQKFRTPRALGTVQTRTLLKDYVHNVTQSFKWTTPRLKVVWDFGGGAPAILAQNIETVLPFDHHFLHDKILEAPLRSFDPTSPGALDTLKARVLSEKADVGLAFDGDGDRLVVMDGRGRVWSGDELLLFFAMHQHNLKTVVADIKASPLLMATLPQTCKTLFTSTGHVHIKDCMRKKNALLGGEVSGHFFFKDRYFGFDDGFYAAVRLLEILQSRTINLITWHEGLPKRFSSIEHRVPLPINRHEHILNTLHNMVPPNAVVDTQDGLKVIFPDGWWIVRSSQTESALVVRWENLTKNGYCQIKRQFESLLKKEFSGHFFL